MADIAEAVADAVKDVIPSEKSSDKKEESPDSDKLPFFYNLLDVYDYAREMETDLEGKKHNLFARWYHGLWGTGKIDSHQWVCWHTPDFISPRFFSWNLSSGLETKDGKTIINMDNFGEPLGKGKTLADRETSINPLEWDKLLFCLFPKFIFFPWFHLLFTVVRYVIIFFRILFVPIEIIGKGVFNIVCPLSGVGLLICPKLGYPWKYNFATKDGEPNNLKPGIGDMLKALLYTTLPVFVFDEEGGYTYGKGGLGVIILAIMAISAVIIFIGGSSVTVAIIGFFMYCLNLIKSLSDFSTDGKEEPASS
jgi:hypothetical protein